MMNRKWSFLLVLLLGFSVGAFAQTLKFNGNGEFKIVQFTDVHYKINNPNSVAALKCIDEVLTKERPDLIVLTGDVVYSSPADKTLLEVLHRVSAYNIPFVYLFGNHDREFGMTNEALYDVARGVKNNIMPDRKGGASPDYTLRIKSHQGNRDAAVLYCMDSHSMAQDPSVGGYAWFTHDQIDWYRGQNAQFTALNGGKPLPALAFFHIPLPEFTMASTLEKAALHGTRMEPACPADINTGMFSAMRLGGDVMGIFCGHDHDNDYSVMYKNILLAYGRFTGGNTEYNHLSNGARIIVLKEGERSFDTYIRLRKGDVIDRTTYPGSYVKDDWRKRPVEE
uniref:Metallophosphoesterase family protein n=1 Tax=Prevotella sp. GTC17260 TaxID=3236796 RepID=A0AB33JCJ0_9BACT